MGPAGAQGGQAGGGLMGFLPIIILFAIFYFLLIRPQQKKAKEHREMIAGLKKGDRVITAGGIYGVIQSIDDSTIGLEIAEKVKIKIARAISPTCCLIKAAKRTPLKNKTSPLRSLRD